MKSLIVPAFAILAVIAATSAAMWRPSARLSAETAAGMPPLEQLYAGAGKLPDQEIDDRSIGP